MLGLDAYASSGSEGEPPQREDVGAAGRGGGEEAGNGAEGCGDEAQGAARRVEAAVEGGDARAEVAAGVREDGAACEGAALQGAGGGASQDAAAEAGVKAEAQAQAKRQKLAGEGEEAEAAKRPKSAEVRRDADGLPALPEGSAPPAMVRRMADFVAKTRAGADLTAMLRGRASYRDPYLMSQLVKQAGIEAYATLLDKEVWDPAGLPKEDFSDALNAEADTAGRAAAEQQRREREKGRMSFVGAGGARPQPPRR